jgi:hypothetical protein
MNRARGIDPPRPDLVTERKLDAVNRPGVHAVTVAVSVGRGRDGVIWSLGMPVPSAAVVSRRA